MGSAAVPALIAAVRKKENGSHRLLAWAHPKVPAVLRRFLPNPYLADIMRSGAVAALHELGTNAVSAVPVLIRAALDLDLSNLSYSYAGLAQATLMKIGEAGIPQFIAVLQDGTPAARAKAALHLGLIGPNAGAAAPALAKALNDPNDAVRNQAVAALAQIGPPAAAALPALREELKLDTDDYRLRVVEALWNIGRESHSILPVLIRVVRDPRNPNRARAAMLLGEMGPEAKAALPVLTEVRREEFSYTRVKADEALRQIMPSITEETAAKR
jgi:HEAT repeat protein